MLSVLQRVSNQAQQAADIINSMRELVRKGNSERKLACLNAVLQDASVLLEADTRRNNISLELSLADPSRPVHVDAVQVEQVVLNLARNAMDAMSDVDRKPTLSIAASEVDEFMQVAVRDQWIRRSSKRARQGLRPVHHHQGERTWARLVDQQNHCRSPRRKALDASHRSRWN